MAWKSSSVSVGLCAPKPASSRPAQVSCPLLGSSHVHWQIRSALLVALTGRSKWVLMKRLGVLLSCDRVRLSREHVLIHRPDPSAESVLAPSGACCLRHTPAPLMARRNSAPWLPFLLNFTTRITLEHAINFSYYFALCLRCSLKCQHAEDRDFSPFPDEYSGPTSGPEVCNSYSRKIFFYITNEQMNE